jgi:hypothetical protein
MTLTSPVLPYGLRDVKLTPINSDGSLGTPVDLPAAQTLSFSEAEEFETLRGDDRDVAIHGKGPKVNFDLEAGGISLEAWQVLTGGTLSDLGATPNQTKTLTKLVTESRPYFQIEGQSINDVDGDTHVLIYKCKVTDTLEGEFADGAFFITSCSGEALGNASDQLYTITWNETSSTITAGVNELQLIVSNATGGTFDLTYSGQTASTLAWDISVSALQTALEALSNLVPGDVLVTGAPGAWYVEFMGTLAETNVSQMTVNNGSLTGGDAAVTTIRAGAAG